MDDRKFDRAYNPSAMSLEKRINKKEKPEESESLLSKISGFDPSAGSDLELPSTPETDESQYEIASTSKAAPKESTPPATEKVEQAKSWVEQQLATLPKGIISEQEKAAYKQKIADLSAMSDAAQSNLEKRELVEGLINSFGQIAGALYGLKHGVDMSGMQFSKTDWDAKIDRSINKFRERMKAVQEEQIGAEKGAEKERDQAVQGLILRNQERKEAADREYRDKQLEASYGYKKDQAQARADKEAAKVSEAQRKEAKKEYDAKEAAVTKILNGDEDNATKAELLSTTFGKDITETDVAKGPTGIIDRIASWFTGAQPKTAAQVKQGVMAKVSDSAPSTQVSTKTVLINGKKFQMTQEAIDKMLADPASKGQNIQVQ